MSSVRRIGGSESDDSAVYGSVETCKVTDMKFTSPVNGFLVDITGVLYNGEHGSDGVVISGSVKAVEMLYQYSHVKFLSNTKGSTKKLAQRLQRLGFNIQEEDIITPAPIVAQYCRETGLRPHLFVRNELLEAFRGIDCSNPNCVVMGEVENGFSYERINEAFRVLLNMDKPLLITMGNGKFFQRTSGPFIDVGAFAAALKFATNCEHVNIGKPNPVYFKHGLNALGMSANEVVMIGDDRMSDVGGAQAAGIRGIQVKTGKYRADFEKMPVTPDLNAECLLDAVQQIAGNGFRL